MITPKIPHNEKERLAELYSYSILDTESEKDFDDVVELASIICEAPISLVTLIDSSRQWFKAKKGVNLDSTAREISFCGHTINQNELFVVEDASKDERFHDNPFVTAEFRIHFYAGISLVSEKGYNIGTLCVLDSVPRKLDEYQRKALEILGNQISKLIELRDKKKQLESKIRTIAVQNEKLESLNKMNTEMTSIISHDMRGPISSVLSYFDSNSFKKSAQEEMFQLFPVIKQSIQGIHNLIENLLEWSQSVGEFHVKPFSVHDCVEEVIMLLQSQATKKNVTLSASIDKECKVMADPSMLRFILRNLVGNAIKFTENGEITISAIKKDNEVLFIAVKDNGIGMPDTLRNRIIKGDKKISTTGTRKEKGSGLGLKLINEFLEKHNSSLKIESEENSGSTFSFTLPLA
ncbi:GAF domain-containing sensor histidine kinase [Marivirga sp. S37H4]|uniref:histidine kinase n=1 Tax=Marivirga aurantiaca TaxID=2802615 RepID=A0A934X0Q0_9BACT|nr:GAF domain-containing sensor histidine kinase [Marivirga aurantiaca]MBK6266793.1 GAF domain-containing sensor histidine kinase [Marivirga aurantiaca]